LIKSSRVRELLRNQTSSGYLWDTRKKPALGVEREQVAAIYVYAWIFVLKPQRLNKYQILPKVT